MRQNPAMPTDLLDARLIATLATLDESGLPYLSSVWFLRDGDDVLVATGGEHAEGAERGRAACRRRARPRPR